VTGNAYADLVRDRIFGPVGMSHSSYIDDATLRAGRAHGYQESNGAVVNARYYSSTLPYSAGGLMSSVDDLARWDAALSGDRLLKKESRERLLSPGRLANGETTGYGFGWYSYEYGGLRVQEHGGVIFGFVAYVLRVPERHLYVALLTNRQAARAEPFLFARKVALAALGHPFADPVVSTLGPAAVDECLGYYEARDKTGVEFLRTGGRLTMTRGRSQPVESSATEFFQPGTFLRVHFERDAEGRIQGATISDWGNAMTVARAAGPSPKR
jgi:D-alanyl-D-alanine carboxypeptidase